MAPENQVGAQPNVRSAHRLLEDVERAPGGVGERLPGLPLRDLHAVDEHDAVADLEPVAGQTHEPLDERLGRQLGPMVGQGQTRIFDRSR